MSQGKNFYEILESSPGSSHEEIRTNYRRLLLLNHPDKVGSDSIEIMQRIQLAWETLRDEESRKDYDNRLNILEMDKRSCVYDEVSVSEFERKIVDEQDLLCLDCRCGGCFVIEPIDLVRGFNLISCSNCTAKTLIK